MKLEKILLVTVALAAVSVSTAQVPQRLRVSHIRATSATPQSGGRSMAAEYGRLPLSFELNTGQADRQVKFLARGPGYSLFLTSDEAVIALKKGESRPSRFPEARRHPGPESVQGRSESKVVRMQLAGASASSNVAGAEELPGKTNYFIGNDPSKWRTNVATYAKVKYENVYPGVDLVYYGNQRQLEYDFIVAPGADPNRIELKFRGAGALRVNENGELLLGASGEAVRLEKPVVYQTASGVKKAVEGRYVMVAANLVRFGLGDYDHAQPLVIDPVLSYSTYLGGVAGEGGRAIAVDASGNAYITGETGSSNFPTTPNALQPTLPSGGFPVFVSKLNASGSALVYSTFLGGNHTEVGYGIAADASGNAYVTGETRSTDFPTVNAVQATPGAGAFQNAFLSKLNASGSALVYSTYLGGTSDVGQAIALDASNSAYVTGYTGSTNFPTVNAIQPALASGATYNAFVTKFNPAGSALVYSTYLGGRSNDYGNGIAVDSSGSAYIVGQTNSPNFPTANAIQPALGTSQGTNAFVTKFNPNGSALVYSTYLGGSSSDVGSAIAVDASGNAYVTGTAGSFNFPTANALQPALGTSNGRSFGNAFVSKLNSSGSALVYSTYLGGSASTFLGVGDGGSGIAVDASGKAYVTGLTGSTNFPTVNALQSTLGNPRGNAFVSVLTAAGSALVFSTYLGGSDGNGDAGSGIAVDASGNAYVTGATGASNFPTVNALQPTFGGNSDAFIAKVSSISGNTPTSTVLVSSLNPAHVGQSVTFTATVTAQASGTPAGAVAFWDGTAGLGMATLNASGQATFTTASLAPGTHSITAIYGGNGTFSGSTSTSLSEEVSVLQSVTVSPNPASVAMGHTLQFVATGHYSDGTNGDVTSAVTWSSSNTAIATVSNAAGTQGLATGVDAGRTAVTITAAQGTISGTAQLTVTHHH